MGILLKSKNNRASKIVEASKESYEKQKAAIENAEKEKEVQKQKIEKEYNDAVASIEAVYKVQNKELEERKKKEIKNIVKKYYNNNLKHLILILIKSPSFVYVLLKTLFHLNVQVEE